MKKKIRRIAIIFTTIISLFLFVWSILVAQRFLQKIIKIGVNKERQATEMNKSDAIPLSPEVEALRARVSTEAERCGIGQYVDLLLAVMMQESGGRMEDVFQASESMGLPPNSIDKNTSIRQGVSVITERLRASNVESPADIEKIKLAIQGYNFGGGYIKFALQNGGGWTQENTYGYAKIHSKGVSNTGKRVEQLGPWRYGDQYYTKHVLRYYPYGNNSGTGDVELGVAGTIDPKQRMKWLFPNGSPTSANQMQQYLTVITVPVLDTNGVESTMRLTVHKSLANEFISIFNEMRQIGFPVRKTDTAGYTWRMMASGTGSLSHHSYGVVVDLNWTSNPMIGVTGGSYRPGIDPYSVTQEVVNIWKKHGFYWGGDWSGSKDYMHFTYTNH